MWADAEFPADPYPGGVPPASFAHVDGVSWPLRPGPWRVGGTPLDTWLTTRGFPPTTARIPLLSYGSNRCPSKITWLRRKLGLGADPVLVLRARTTGVAAVWASGLRYRDGQRPAVLAAAPDVREKHGIWLATPAQIAVLDRCEGRDDRFRLARLRTSPRVRVRTEDGALVTDPWCYLGHGAIRRPLLVDGRPVRCAEVPQALARALDGEPATGDGLAADTVVGEPQPDEWPAALFAYGLLQPGQPAWRLVGPHAAGPTRPATVPGAVLDTGRDYPAWLPERDGRTPGVVVPLRDPAALLPALDAFEGPDYQRVRVVVPDDGTVCWAYAWRSPTTGFRPLPHGWVAARST
ncbi:MAG TPA: gamma-glutamylcyclotransferase family protein [Pseudonocardia sp.]|nr:gamma-glutamylcyclotransferase family protein [Pseudonocardia sp.]